MLADKIICERKKKGWSQEELAERLEVSRQSVSKWEGGLSVPELDKIIAMSELFGVSTDYLLKKGADSAEPDMERETEDKTEKTSKRVIPSAETQDYIALVRTVSRRVALGVALCILSPVALILLAGVSDAGMLSEEWAAGIGLGTLFLLIGAALALFIPSGLRLGEYSYLEKEAFDLEAPVEHTLKEDYETYAKTHRVMVTVGALLAFISPVPLIVVSCIWEDWTVGIVSCVCILLAIVAIGVFFIVRTSYVNSAYQKLLQLGEYDRRGKVRNAVKDAVSTLYWGLVTAIYLVVSFLTGAWHLTWLVWVVASAASPFLELWLKNRKIHKEN